MTTYRTIYQVDAFTLLPFKGNPAGVCILEKKEPDHLMQSIAAEMNLSETAFIIREKKKFRISYFTPESEIPLCGHATLSAAHIMFETGVADKNEKIVFLSKAGELTVSIKGTWITMNFPAYKAEQIRIPENSAKILGFKPAELYRTSHGWTLGLYKDEDEVRSLNPDFNLMKETEFGKMIATATSDDKNFDFCVRCFVPALGINEDPVTGSAHCALAPFWTSKTGRTEFISHQVSKRGGILKVALSGDRVNISGQAKTILKAEMYI